MWRDSRSLRAALLDIGYWGAKRAREHVGCDCPTVLLPPVRAQALRCSLVLFAAHKGTFTLGLQSCCAILRNGLEMCEFISGITCLWLFILMFSCFFASMVWRLHGFLSALEGVSCLQSNRQDFHLLEQCLEVLGSNTALGSLFSWQMPGEGLVPY